MTQVVPPRRIPAAVFSLLVQAVELVVQISASVLLARWLGPESFGRFNYAMSVAGILAIFLLFGTEEIAIRMYAARPSEPQRILGASLVILGGGALVCVVSAVGIGLVGGVDAAAGLAIGLAILTLVANGLAAAANQAILAYEATGRDVANMLVSRSVLAAGIVAAATTGSVPACLAAYALAAAVLAALRFQTIHRHLFPLRRLAPGPVLSDLWRQGRKVGASAIFASVLARADQLLLQRLASLTAVGLYGACYRLLNGVSAGVTALTTALYPGLLRGLQTHQQTWERRLFRVAPLGLAVLLACLSFAAPHWIVETLYGPGFAGAAVTMRILLAAAAVQTVAVFVRKYAIAVRQEGYLPWVLGIAATVNVAANLWLIPLQADVGAAWATLIAEGVGLVCILPVLRARAPR